MRTGFERCLAITAVQDLLARMRGFVAFFFGCDYCRDHFLEAARGEQHWGVQKAVSYHSLWHASRAMLEPQHRWNTPKATLYPQPAYPTRVSGMGQWQKGV